VHSSAKDTSEHSPPAAEQRNTVWMRKRILDEMPLRLIPAEQILSTIHRACARYYSEKGLLQDSAGSWEVALHMSVNTTVNSSNAVSGAAVGADCSFGQITSGPGLGLPWSQQVGPSCGLQALRFARHIIRSSDCMSSAADAGHRTGARSRVYVWHGDGGKTQYLNGMPPVNTSLVQSTHSLHDTVPAGHQAAGGAEASHSRSLLSLAVHLGYTVEGEMYDIRHMCDLAQRYLSPHCGSGGAEEHYGGGSGGSGGSGVEVYVQGMWDLPCYALCNLILGSGGREHGGRSGGSSPVHRQDTYGHVNYPTPGSSRTGLILFPYDRDDAGSLPGLKAGAAAHYALLCGMVVLPAPTGGTWSSSALVESDIDPERVLLVGMQGLSPQPVVAPYSAWVASNAQLHCASAKMPREGDVPSLRGNCVVIRCHN
jgi:hypothetical protein